MLSNHKYIHKIMPLKLNVTPSPLNYAITIKVNDAPINILYSLTHCKNLYINHKTSTQIQSILLGELKRKYIKGINEEHLKNILERGRASVINVIPANNLDTKTVENFQLNFFKFPLRQNVNNIFLNGEGSRTIEMR